MGRKSLWKQVDLRTVASWLERNRTLDVESEEAREATTHEPQVLEDAPVPWSCGPAADDRPCLWLPRPHSPWDRSALSLLFAGFAVPGCCSPLGGYNGPSAGLGDLASPL